MNKNLIRDLELFAKHLSSSQPILVARVINANNRKANLWLYNWQRGQVGRASKYGSSQRYNDWAEHN